MAPHGNRGARRPVGGRRGTTLLELLVAMTIAALLIGLAVRRIGDAAAREATRAAARDVSLLLSAARQVAATNLAGAAVGFDVATARIHLTVGGDTARSIDLAATYGVRLRAGRDSLAYDGRGLAVGAANLTLVVTRGPAADTVVVSRLGRVRGGRW